MLDTGGDKNKIKDKHILLVVEGEICRSRTSMFDAADGRRWIDGCIFSVLVTATVY